MSLPLTFTLNQDDKAPAFLDTNLCTVGQKNKTTAKKKKNTPIKLNANYHTEMKLGPIIMDYCLFQFDTLKFFFRLRLNGDIYLTLFFLM